jgi:hypothetical protein
MKRLPAPGSLPSSTRLLAEGRMGMAEVIGAELVIEALRHAGINTLYVPPG